LKGLPANAKVAIKKIYKNKLDPIRREFARNELAIHSSLAKLNENIVQVHDYYEDKEGYTIVMEFADKPNFFEAVEDVIINYPLILT